MTPAEKQGLGLKRIGFFTLGSPFDGETLHRSALGGSETALIQAARALAERGHDVSVFNNCPRPGVYDRVRYLPWRSFPTEGAPKNWDVFVVSRFYDFFNLPFRSGLKVLWNHDTLANPARLRALADRIDLFFFLSQFHRINYTTHLPELEKKLHETRNGLDLDLIDQSLSGAVKDPNRVIYASRPERGLEVLLRDIWPRMLQARPNLKLQICGYGVDWTGLPPEVKKTYRRLEEMIEASPNVEVLGELPKVDYYRRLAEASLMIYPCSFPEISCIAALEAQACRTGLVTSDAFALSETVKEDAFKVPGRPDQPGYKENFTRRALELLADPAQTAELAARAEQKVREKYNWPRITAEWDRLFDLSLKSPQRKQAGPTAGPQASNSTQSNRRPWGPAARVLLLDTGYYLVREIFTALEASGRPVRRLQCPGRGVGSEETIQRLRKEIDGFCPDFLLTINHLGFDEAGALTGLLASIGLPLASWFVDSPLLIFGRGKNNVSEACSLFLWDRDYISDLRAVGFDKVHYLPLATDPQVFRPLSPQALRGFPPARVGFVGDSMTGPVRRVMERLNLGPVRPAFVEKAAELFAQNSDRTPGPILESLTRRDSYSAEEFQDLQALVTWRATQKYRETIVRAMKGLEACVAGDPGWRELIGSNGFRLLPQLDYYTQLPGFYQACDINLNATSLQMKTGVNQRVFDVPAVGGFLLTDHRDQMSGLFDLGREAVCFSDPEEARELAEYYLRRETERTRIAGLGRERVLKDHTYRRRIDFLVETMRKDHAS